MVIPQETHPFISTGAASLENKKHTWSDNENPQDNAGFYGLLAEDSYSNDPMPNPVIHASLPGGNTDDTTHMLSAMSTGIPANAYLSQEWQITGTWGSHANLVWPTYTGAGVIITDLDDGFQTNNTDYASNYSTALSYDFVTNRADGAAAGATDYHGTSVMGLMIGNGAAGHGSLGVAYGAEAFGMRVSFGDGSLTQIQQGFQYALSHGAGVMNNSWGFTSEFSDDFGAVDGYTVFSGIASSMQAYAAQGRNGLGGVAVFAAGNDRTAGDNTNYHNMQNSPYVITVAAIDSNGNIASFSTPGTSILVSAAGVNDVTTNDTQNGGYVPGSAYIYFSGTSAAAPIVSGVVALMEQANAHLGWRDIQEILAYSAQYNDPASSTWQYNGAVNWNGGGLHYSSDFGFGAVNAATAVALAQVWTLQNTAEDSANMLTVNGGTLAANLAIHTTAAVTSSINVMQNINIEHVEVNLNITDTSLSHMIVTLIAPDGTKSVLIDDPTNGTSGNNISFQATTDADLGETSAGKWTLQVQDTASGATGELNSWGITFLGSAVSNNHTYIYTDDYGTYTGAALAARDVLRDTSGGVDTLNLAAMTGSSNINLATGTCTIDGKALSIAAGTVIDNVYFGSGNSTVTGNNGNDYIYASTGHDVITLGNGTDTVNMSTGIDTITAGAGKDTFIFNAAETTAASISHFSTTAGDAINLSAVLSYTGAVSQAIANYVELTTQGSNTLVSISASGNGHFTAEATLTGVTGLNLTTLIHNGDLIV